jgi:hypothetical protein
MLRTFIVFLFIYSGIFAQNTAYKPFSGSLTYKVELVDSTLKKGKFQYYMRVYTNDTLVRTENESPLFGKQILIKNLNLKKQYLLLNINDKKYAIQQNIPLDTLPSKYKFEIKSKFKKFGNKKSQLAITTLRNYPTTFKTYYAVDLNPIYLDILKGLKGLPTQYFIPSVNGIFKYTLIEIEETPLPSSTFLFSKDYTKISFDEFIKIATESNKSN